MNALLQTLETRQGLYQVLASLYQREITEKTLPVFREAALPKAPEDTEFNRASEALSKALNALQKEGLDELAADFARTFLSAGIADGVQASPFESVYTSREKLIMQDAYEAVLREVRSLGLGTVFDDLMPDHIGIELELMAIFTGKTIEALKNQKTDEAVSLLEKQKEFLSSHLLNWTPEFFKNQTAATQSALYRSLAQFTEAFLREDAAWLAA